MDYFIYIFYLSLGLWTTLFIFYICHLVYGLLYLYFLCVIRYIDYFIYSLYVSLKPEPDRGQIITNHVKKELEAQWSEPALLTYHFVLRPY